VTKRESNSSARRYSIWRQIRRVTSIENEEMQEGFKIGDEETAKDIIE